MSDTSLRCTPSQALRRALYAPCEAAETTDPSIYRMSTDDERQTQDDPCTLDDTLDTAGLTEEEPPTRRRVSALQGMMLAVGLLGATAMAAVALLLTSAVLAASFTMAEGGASIAAIEAPAPARE